MKTKRDWLLGGVMLMLAAFLIVTGCGSGKDSAGGSGSSEHADHGMTTEGEILETTSGPDELPAFLLNHTNRTVDLYAASYEYREILRQINCYCGCMKLDNPHDSLLRCYIAEVRADGSIVWSDHSAACGICKMELEDVMVLAKQGKSTDEIRDAIDAKYKPAGL